MVTHDVADSEQGVTKLVSGIIDDAQELFKTQLELFKLEIKSDVTKTKDAAIMLIAGMLVALVGGVLLCTMLVYLLHELVNLPLWVSYLIVGGIMAAIGAATSFAGIKKFESFNPLPEKSVEALKENLQWTNNSKS